jgi:hypothetical protein
VRARGTPRRTPALVLGVLSFGAAAVLPRPLGDASRPFEEPGPPGWVERVDARLELRMPSLGDDERRRLARTLVEESESARVDPLLVLALIEIESSYDPAAVSHRGARGLMQLREPTFRREAERAGREWQDPHDPAVNVQAGIRYLRRLLDAFGREEVALMAYNAGPNRILGYLRGGGIPERFRIYPGKVRAEVRRLRRAFGAELGPTIALARTGSRAAPE